MKVFDKKRARAELRKRRAGAIYVLKPYMLIDIGEPCKLRKRKHMYFIISFQNLITVLLYNHDYLNNWEFLQSVLLKGKVYI